MTDAPLRERIHSYIGETEPTPTTDIEAMFDAYATGAIYGAIGRLAEEERVERNDDGFLVTKDPFA